MSCTMAGRAVLVASRQRHHKFQRNLMTCAPSMYRLLLEIQREQNRSENKIIQILHPGYEGHYQRLKYRQVNAGLKTLFSNYNNYSQMKYLKCVAKYLRQYE